MPQVGLALWGIVCLGRLEDVMEKMPITPEGLSRLQEELKRLKTIERPSVIRALEEARTHGDLSENAEYHAARERQSFIEGRVAELEDKIRRAEVIDVSKLTGKAVKFGATVVLVDEDTDEKVTYLIVGAEESDITKGKLSIISPLARALIGKEVGDTVEVSTPRGSKVYEIVKVKF
jgi:transcription elongation factor GreA